MKISIVRAMGICLLFGVIPLILSAEPPPLPVDEPPQDVASDSGESYGPPDELDLQPLESLPPLPDIEETPSDLKPEVFAAYLGTGTPGTWVRFEFRVTSLEAKLLQEVRVEILERGANRVRLRVQGERHVRPGRMGPGSGPFNMETRELTDWDLSTEGGQATRFIYDPDLPPTMALREETMTFQQAVVQLPGLEGVHELGRFTGTGVLETPLGRLTCRIYQRGSDLVWIDPDRPLGGLVRIKARDGSNRVDVVRLAEGTAK